jgi:hypothetical protein
MVIPSIKFVQPTVLEMQQFSCTLIPIQMLSYVCMCVPMAITHKQLLPVHAFRLARLAILVIRPNRA